MKPSECKDSRDAEMLKEQGVGLNKDSILVKPNVVEMKLGHNITIRIPQLTFKRFAEWYLTEQDSNEIKLINQKT